MTTSVPESLDALIARYASLVRHAIHVTARAQQVWLTREDARDVQQAVYLRVAEQRLLDRARAYLSQHEGDFGTVLFKVTRNVTLNWLRTRSRHAWCWHATQTTDPEPRVLPCFAQDAADQHFLAKLEERVRHRRVGSIALADVLRAAREAESLDPVALAPALRRPDGTVPHRATIRRVTRVIRQEARALRDDHGTSPTV